MRFRLLLLCVLSWFGPAIHASELRLADAYPDKSRYAPSDTVSIIVEMDGRAAGDERIEATIWRLGLPVGKCDLTRLSPGTNNTQTVHCSVPHEDFQGYLVTVELIGGDGRKL